MWLRRLLVKRHRRAAVKRAEAVRSRLLYALKESRRDGVSWRHLSEVIRGMPGVRELYISHGPWARGYLTVEMDDGTSFGVCRTSGRGTRWLWDLEDWQRLAIRHIIRWWRKKRRAAQQKEQDR